MDYNFRRIPRINCLTINPMKTLNLLLQALKLGFSLDANKKIVPYFLGCVGWISVASAIVPSLEYLEFVGGAVFFVFMTSLIINEEHAHNGILPLPILVKRVQNLFVVTVISTLIIGVGLLLLVVPGIVASKKLIYSGIMVALGKTNASKALNMSKSLSNVNGYKLLGAMILLTLIVALLAGVIQLLSTTEAFVALGGLGTILMIILKLISAWVTYTITNHMLIIAYNEAIALKDQ